MHAVTSLVMVSAVAPQAVGAEASKTHDLPAIGLRIRMPERMTPLPLDRLTDWVRLGVKGKDDTYEQILVLSALPEGTRRNAKTAAEMWVLEARQQRDAYHAISQRKAEWMNEGWEVLATYKVNDKSVTSLQWFGWREADPAVVYVLTYDVVEGRADAMRPVIQRVASSCTLTPVRPLSAGPATLGRRRTLPKEGISLELIQGLRPMVPNRDNMLMRAGAVDYVRDRLLPVLTVTTNEIKPRESAEQRLLRSVERLLPALKPAEGKVESKRPAKLGDRQAYEVVLGLTQRRVRLWTAMRLSIWKGKALVLSITYPAEDGERLGAAMEAVAASVRFEPDK